MPIPTPEANEKRNDFIQRCMADEIMVNEYQDEKQRMAICSTSWKNAKKLADIKDIYNGEYVTLDNVEILNVYPNSHNIKFSKKDLVEILSNYEKLKNEYQLIPIVKVSHSDQQLILKKLFDVDEVDGYEELPLLGIVEDMKLNEDGTAIKAKIGRIPAKISEVYGKMFKAVSPEIIFNWRGTGQKVLRAIALTNMPSQKHILDVAMSDGLVCGDIIFINEGVENMAENIKEQQFVDERIVDKLADKLAGIFKKPEKPADDNSIVLSMSQYEDIKNEMNELKKKLMEKEEHQKNFSETIAKIKEQARIEKAEALCSRAMADGVPKVVIDKIKPLLLSEIGEQTIKLSKIVDDKPMEANVSVYEIVKDLFDNYPGQKIDMSEKTVTELSAPSEDKMKLVRAKAQEYVKSGLSEHEALMKAGQEILK